MGALSYVPVMPGFDKQTEVSELEQLDILQEEAIKVLSEKGLMNTKVSRGLEIRE